MTIQKEPRPPEINITEDGTTPLVVLPTGTGRIKAYVRGAFTTVTFGYREAKSPNTFHAFSTAVVPGGSADTEVLLEPGPNVQVHVAVVGTSGGGVFIGLSGSY